MKNAYRALVENPEGKTEVKRPRFKWQNNVKCTLKIVWEGRDWILLAQKREESVAKIKSQKKKRRGENVQNAQICCRFFWTEFRSSDRSQFLGRWE